jgi:hypothetical protein
LAQEAINLDAALKEIDATIEDRFRRHHYAEIIVSLPGSGHAWAQNSSPPWAVTSRSMTAPIGWPASPV